MIKMPRISNNNLPRAFENPLGLVLPQFEHFPEVA